MAPKRPEQALEEIALPSWNSGLIAETDFDCSPAKHVAAPSQAKDGGAAPRTYGVGRVRAGAQPSAAAPAPAVQRAWKLEEPGSLRVGGLDKLPNAREAEFWLRRAAAEQEAGRPERAAGVLREALQRDVRPATSITRALAALERGDAAGSAAAVTEEEPVPVPRAAPAAAPPPPRPSENDAPAEELPLAVPGALPDQPPRSTRKAFTPSRTGLTGKAQRVPSRFARTPAPAATAAAGGAAAEGAATGLQTAGVLKKLSFSVAKPRLEAQLVALEAEMATVRLRSTAGAAGGRGPATATKHLRFGATPAGAATASRGGRHVTFDASTVSPAARGAALACAPAAAQPLPVTPEPPALEAEGSGSGPGSNTANAGHTPFDKRLSSLFHKYAESTPGGVAEDLLDNLEGMLRSPSWKRLSTVSVPDSIKLLSQKYDEEAEASAAAAGLSGASSAASPPLAGTPGISITAAAAAAAAGLPGTPGPAPSTSSPAAVAATPHDQLPGYLTKNAAYESPEAAAVAAAAAEAEAATPATVAARAMQQLTPNTAIAQLLGPMLRVTIEEIEGGKAAAAVPVVPPAAQPGPATAAAHAAEPADDALLLRSSVSPVSGAVHLMPGFPALPRARPAGDADEIDAETLVLGGSGGDIDLAEEGMDASPASFGGFALPGAATPEITMPDGVPRDEQGVPRLTPATVTVRRGRSSTPSLEVFPGHAGALAADLFAGGAFGSPTEEELRAQEAAARRARATPAGGAAAAAAPAPAATPQCDFSFFPAAAQLVAAPQQQEAQPAMAGAGPADTPDLRTGGVAPDASPAPPGPSPEILGFFESQLAAAEAEADTGLEAEAQQLVAAAEPAVAPAPAAHPAHVPSPLLPRSIIKSGRLVTEDGTPVLGRALRVTPGAPGAPPSPAAPPEPPTITKELRVLMSGLSLDDREALASRGTVPTLSPVRATGAARHAAAAVAADAHAARLGKVITPVRRSARVRVQQRPLEAMLEEAEYSYVPNEAMMDEEAEPKQEAKARKAASRAASAASSRGATTAGAGAGQPEVDSCTTPGALAAAASKLASSSNASLAAGAGSSGGGATPGRRYGTRSAARAVPAAEQAMPGPEGCPQQLLHALRTPTMMAHVGAGGAGSDDAMPDAVTPVAVPAASSPAAAASPVVQDDSSPRLSESPTAIAAAVPAAKRYSLRESTLRKSMGAAPTPMGAAAAAAAATAAPAVTPLGSGFARQNSSTPVTATRGRKRGGSAAGSPGGPSAVKLSPTEAGIRASLRSATKRRQQQEQQASRVSSDRRC